MWLLTGSALALHLLAVVLASLHLVLQNKRPPAQLAWLLAMLALPIVGVATYALFGSDRIAMGRLRHRRHFDARTLPGYEVPDTWRRSPEQPLWQALGEFNGFGTVSGCQVEIIGHAAEYYRQLHEAIGQAQDQVWLCFYIWRNDDYGREMVEACTDAARRGVDVRVIVDEVGSLGTTRRLFAPLLEAGGRMTWTNMVHLRRWRWFVGLRNHRKIVVIDGVDAFTGGMNIGSEYVDGRGSTPWRDLQIRLRGPVVRQLGTLFADDWHFATDEKLPPPAGEPTPEPEGVPALLVAGFPEIGSGRAETSILLLVQSAQRRIMLTTPYFVPDIPLVVELELAVARGVEVVLFVSNKCDMGPIVRVSRTFYDRLLCAGVIIKEYQPRCIHHTKSVLIDDRFCLLGSINLDVRSFRLNFEVGVLFDDPTITAEVEELIEDRAVDATVLDLQRFRERPLHERLYEGLLCSFAPIL